MGLSMFILLITNFKVNMQIFRNLSLVIHTAIQSTI